MFYDNTPIGTVRNPDSLSLSYGQTSDVLGGQIDEMLNRDGQINPHWHTFMQALNTLGLAEIESLDKEVQRLLRENGVTYVLHGERQEASTVGTRSYSIYSLEHRLANYL